MDVLAILAVIIFLSGSYLMGNYFLDSFNDTIGVRLLSSLYGILCWCVVGVVAIICFGIYIGISTARLPYIL